MFKNLRELEDFFYNKIKSYYKSGTGAINPSLKTMNKICETVSLPKDKLKNVIHVAGTNGKGSTIAILDTILQQKYDKVATYTSPHLIKINERIKINGNEITDISLLTLANVIIPKVIHLGPTFFELFTLLALYHFVRENVDIILLETGLGGRWDATNIIDANISVITRISYDHTDILGNSLTEIAYEKAGIIKENSTVILSENRNEVLEVIKKVANEKKADFIYVPDGIFIEEEKDSYIIFDKEEHKRYIFKSDLQGKYQKNNFATAFAVAKKLNISPESFIEKLANITEISGIKGRWQQIGQKIFADAAHNYEGMKETLKTASEYAPLKDWVFLLGFAKNKDISKILTLFPQEATIFFCSNSYERLISASELKEIATNMKFKNSYFYDNLQQGYRKFYDFCQENDKYGLVSGSFYIVGDVLKYS